MTRAISRLPHLRGVTQVAILLLAMFGLVFFAPYHFPVAPSVSLSYLTGFSNRAAFILFAAGCVVFAALTRGDLGALETKNQRLGLWSLTAALAIVAGCCVLSLYPVASLPHGQEAQYSLNRWQMLVAGGRPYLDFEYAYGAAQLYIPLALVKLGSSVFAAYYVVWAIEWLAGTAILWLSVRWLELPVPYRRLVFWAMFAMELRGVFTQSFAYTPVRAFGATFLVLAVFRVWQRWRRPVMTAAVGLGAAACGLAISPELGIGVAVGLLGWLLLLAVRRDSGFTGQAWALFALATVGMFVAADRAGVLITLKSFAGGAYCYPLLPTVPVLCILCVYLIAACAAGRNLFQHNYESMAIPLAVAGFAMLQAAMGRCDLGRLQSAAPAFLLGVAAIEAMPYLRLGWRPIALFSLVLPLGIIGPVSSIHYEFERVRQGSAAPSLGLAPTACGEIYRTPNLWPAPNAMARQACLDTGYTIDYVNAFTPAAIERKIADLDRRPRQPILLLDRPMPEQMATLETDVSELDWEGPSLFQPRIVHQPVTYAAIFAYIQENYVPDPEPVSRDGVAYRVWRPKPASPP